MPDADENSFDSPAIDLVFQIMEANSRALSSTTNQLMASYIDDLREARALVALIRNAVSDLIDGPYLPSAASIRGCLWPSQAEVEYELSTYPEAYPATYESMTGGDADDFR